MSATPAQIASAKALAKSRGYDPALVDEDNADRANSAFPVQNKPSAAPAAAAPKPVSAPVAAPVSQGGGGVPAAATPPSMAALNKVITPTPGAVTADATPPSMASIMGGAGEASGGLIGSQQGALRPLGRRMPPQQSMEIASRGRRVY